MTSFKQNSTGVIYLSISKIQYIKTEDIWIKNSFFDIDLSMHQQIKFSLYKLHMYVYTYIDLYLYIYWIYTKHILCT